MVGKVASIAREPQARAAHLSSPSLMADFALYFERASFGVLRVMVGGVQVASPGGSMAAPLHTKRNSVFPTWIMT